MDVGEISGRWSHQMEFTDSRVRPFVLIPSSITKIDIDAFTRHRPVKSAPCLMQKRPRSFQKLSTQNQSKNQTNHGGQSVTFQLFSATLLMWDKQTMVQAHGRDQGQGYGGSDICQVDSRGRTAGECTSARAVGRQARTEVLQGG